MGNARTSSAEQERSRGSSKFITFDIPAQPLAQALDAYSVVTGMAGLVEQQLAMVQRSAGVKGRLTADQALRILLAGTNLSIRYGSSSAFILAPIDRTVTSEPANGSAAVPTAIRQAYFSDLQETLTQLFCRRPESQPGSYRLGLQLWIGSNGIVQASHLLNSTGDRGRDAAITDLLGSAMLAVPPAELPQPITVVLLPHSEEKPPDCSLPGRHTK
ncbi:TonB-dependent outer membrane receptor [Bradyrhizobium sp. Leo170]|nr:TonB-dependent outer membrane receptor [Bradyrhizobium sp. Leo170]